MFAIPNIMSREEKGMTRLPCQTHDTWLVDKGEESLRLVLLAVYGVYDVVDKHGGREVEITLVEQAWRGRGAVVGSWWPEMGNCYLKKKINY